jgi:hypothetical protein
MMRMAFIGIAAALIASGAGAQNPPSPAFDVASVKANRSGAQMQAFPTLQPSGRVFAINLPLRELIRTAYGLRDNELVISSPLAGTPFDIEARAAGVRPGPSVHRGTPRPRMAARRHLRRLRHLLLRNTRARLSAPAAVSPSARRCSFRAA